MTQTKLKMRIVIIHMLAAVTCVTTQAVQAAPKCNISATGVNFGNYNVFSNIPNDSGIGSITIDCKGGGGNPTYPVTLDTGQSGSYINRSMNSGSNQLSYNLYTSSARNVIWGDGSGGSSIMQIPEKATTSLSIFGRIPAGQDAAVGIYSDSITATVIF